MPKEPEAFTEQVAAMIRRMQPGYSIELLGPRELLINGRRLDLDNLIRMVGHEPARGLQIVEHFLDQLFTGESLDVADVPLEFAKPRIMPRIQPESIFQHLSREMVAHMPFVNGTVVVFVTDLPQMTVSITTEQVIRWGIDLEELERIARRNLDKYSPDLEMRVVESKEGGRAVVLAEQDGYDAARLLMTDLFDRLAPELGGDFYVAAPARDMFVALSVDPEAFIRRLHDKVSDDFRRLPYPITDDFFYVTRDGVAGTRGEAA